MTAKRRSPAPAERKRDPDRTRERILDAAVAEFGDHGYAGARVSAIARRAGVNQQLISYYFDGKAGLYRALSERWREVSAGVNLDERPLADVVADFLAESVQRRQWTRLLVWEGLTGESGSPEGGGFFAAMVEDVRRRQDKGELAADLDPAAVLLVLFSAAMAPVALPQVVRGATGMAPDSPDFLEGYREHLRRIVERLR
jgi:TetR/AcrR family transcriptional regulator